MMRLGNTLAGVGGILLVAAVVTAAASLYTLDETQQALILQFGRPIGDPVVEPGLHVKLPFVQEVRRFDRRLQSWDGDPNQVPTRGRQFISVDTTARWRVADPLTFYQKVGDIRGAINRLNDILDSIVRDRIASTDLTEIVRSKDWKITKEDLADLLVVGEGNEEKLLEEVRGGRQQLVAQVLEGARAQVEPYGIDLVDIRIKRLGYVEEVQERVYERMISERQRIAEQFRSEGRGRAAEIDGATQRELSEIRSDGVRRAEILRGEADATATRIYNEAFGADPEFYAFYRTMQSYPRTLGSSTTLVLGADAEYFRFLGDPSSAP